MKSWQMIAIYVACTLVLIGIGYFLGRSTGKGKPWVWAVTFGAGSVVASMVLWYTAGKNLHN